MHRAARKTHEAGAGLGVGPVRSEGRGREAMGGGGAPREKSREGPEGGTIRPLPTLGALYAGGGLARIDLKDRESAALGRGARPRAKRPGRRTKDAPARLNCWPAEMLKCCPVQSLGNFAVVAPSRGPWG
jgi:hypothetical protein